MAGGTQQSSSGRLSVLGVPSLRAASGQYVTLPAKAYELIAYVILDGDDGVASRAELARFLWESVDRHVALGNLRQLIARIRRVERTCACQIITANRTHVRLRPDCTRIDLAEVAALLPSIDWSTLPALIEAFSGDLLQTSARMERDTPADWIAARVRGLRDQVVDVITRMLDRSDAVEHREAAEAAARRLLQLDQFNEPAYRALMRLRAAQGRAWEAKRLFEECRTIVERELNAPLDAKTISLLDEILGVPRSASQAGGERRPPQPQTAGTNSRGDGARPSAARISVLPKLAILLPQNGGGDIYDIATSLLEDVNFGLCSLNTLLVVAPYTSSQIGTSADLQDSVEKLGLTYLVETSLHTVHGNKLTVNLIDARSRVFLWGSRVPLGSLELPESYRVLCSGVVASLADAVEQIELSRSGGLTDRKAYYSYLLGQVALRHFDLENARRARREFRKAIALSPEFAPAHSGVARAMHTEWILLARGDTESLAETERFARRAIELDPRDSSGHRELGSLSLYRRRFDESIAHFTDAERRHPRHADLLADFADSLAHGGNPAAGLKKLEQAIALNPIVPDNYLWRAAGMNFQLHRYEAAIEVVLRMADQRPAYRLLAASYALFGDRITAREYQEKALEIYPDFKVNQWLSIVPNRNPDDERHYQQGLRAAGFQ